MHDVLAFEEGFDPLEDADISLSDGRWRVKGLEGPPMKQLRVLDDGEVLVRVDKEADEWEQADWLDDTHASLKKTIDGTEHRCHVQFSDGRVDTVRLSNTDS